MGYDRVRDDPLAALAAELEKLSAAQLELGEAAERLGLLAGEGSATALADAAAAARAAARDAAAASARLTR
jgi:hypothetical protein